MGYDYVLNGESVKNCHELGDIWEGCGPQVVTGRGQ